MTIIYVAGPISGIKDHNRPLFNMVADELADQGHSVLNPAILPDGLNQGQYMQICLPMVAVAHELVMLPGWEQSEGAYIEFCLAKKSGKTVRGLWGAFCIKEKAMSNNAMSNETDLDWLARNVHVWREGKREVLVCWPRNVDTLIWSYVLSDTGWITKAKWLARRAELQNKPGWDHEAVPAWATALAQDQDGEWKWLGDNVTQYVDGFTADKIRAQCKGVVLGSWRDTLEKRPEQDDFVPFVSVEDERHVLSELEMLGKVSHLISDKRHRITTSKYTKTIHGVPVDVYDVLQAWGVINPALQHLIKKALQCGQRGHKDNAQDLQDIIDSAIRAKELG